MQITGRTVAAVYAVILWVFPPIFSAVLTTRRGVRSPGWSAVGRVLSNVCLQEGIHMADTAVNMQPEKRPEAAEHWTLCCACPV